jgi:DNA-binding XRE family transcriptional regulator
MISPSTGQWSFEPPAAHERSQGTDRPRKSRPGYPEDDPKTLGEHLRRVRLDRGLSQRQAAEAIGCHPTALLHWEKGHAEPELRFLPAILRFLGV